MDDGNTSDHSRHPDDENPSSFKTWNLSLRLALATIGLLPLLVIALKAKSLGSRALAIIGIGIPVLEGPYLLMILFSLPRNVILRAHVSGALSKGMAGIYRESRSKETIFHRVLMASRAVIARAGVLASWWLALTVLVPRLKGLILLGSPLWRWGLLAFTTPAAYFAALSLCMLLALPISISGIGIALAPLPLIRLRVVPLLKIKILHQYLYVGLIPSITLVIYFGILLGSWLLYFSTERGLKHAGSTGPHPEAFEYVTWTCVSLCVGSVLWFLKTLFLLKWSANAIYRRFEPRILITGVKFLYLGAIVGGFFESPIVRNMELLEEYARHPEPQKFSFTNYIMSKQRLDTSYLQDVGHLLTSLAAIVRPLQEDGVPQLLEFFERHKIHQTTEDWCQPDDLLKLLECHDLTNESLIRAQLLLAYGPFYQLFTEKDEIPSSDPQTEQFSPETYRKNTANVLHCIVREQCASADNHFTFDDLKKWMVDAHMNCVNMGRTLSDASAIVTRLDIFISFVIIVVVVLLWLLITGIATTTVLVTVVTPLLALTFIFGDSAKQFFQGIVFCFGTHAFDVGDRCILDDTELEVKSINILTTTFITIGTVEKRMYPNSVLATKAIVNLGWQPDPSDTVELTLDLSTSPAAWRMLKVKINEFFNNHEQRRFFQSKHEVMMKETGDKIKVTIHFKHVLNVSEMTHGECLQKKNRQRSIILQKISHFLDPDSPIREDDDNGGFVNSQVIPSNDHDQPSITSEIMEH